MQNACRSFLPKLGNLSRRARPTISGGTLSRVISVRLTSSDSKMEYNFETLKVTRPREFVVNVELNRPEKSNAMNRAFWREMVECFNQISQDEDCRAVVLTGAGKNFTAGLDLTDFGSTFSFEDSDISKKAKIIRKMITDFQESFTVIEKCPKPVIAAIQSACVGGGVDMTSACDIRYCTQDAWFQIREIDIGMVADVGTLQRLPGAVGSDSLARELCYTGRKMMSDEAKECGFVNRVYPDKASLIEGALGVAEEIAAKSPVAVQGTKVNLVYSRDHSVAESLDYVATWNQGMLQSEDFVKAIMAQMQKEKAVFSKL